MTHVAEIALSTEDVVAVGGFFRDVAGAQNGPLRASAIPTAGSLRWPRPD